MPSNPGVWGSRFPCLIILPKDIDGGKHWGGTQCHRYDFLVRFIETDLIFLNFYLHLGLITTPHVLYVHMTYVYSLFSCFILHTIIWPREVIIVL